MICARCKGTFFGKPVEARFPDGSWKLIPAATPLHPRTKSA